MLDGAPLPSDSFIRDFRIGRASYVADSLEQALLLPQDMAELRNLEKHEVLLTLKRDLALVISHSQAPNPHLYYFYFFHFLLRLKKKNTSILLSFPLSYAGSSGISCCQGVGEPCLVQIQGRGVLPNQPPRLRLQTRRGRRKHSLGLLKLRGEEKVLR